MLFPFTNQKEILDWATRYTKDQTPKRQRQEEDVRKIREKVEARKEPETPRWLSHEKRIDGDGRLETSHA